MREETVERMMIEVLKREKEKLDTLEPGTDEYKRVSTEYNEHCTRMTDYRKQKRDRIVRACVDGAGIILPLVFYASWLKQGFRFEESGHLFASSTCRVFISKLRPDR